MLLTERLDCLAKGAPRSTPAHKEPAGAGNLPGGRKARPPVPRVFRTVAGRLYRGDRIPGGIGGEKGGGGFSLLKRSWQK